MSNPGGIQTGTSGNALVIGRIVTANMTFYVVDEERLTNLSAASDETWTFSSVGSALLSLGIGFYTAQFFTDKLSPAGWVISHVVCWIVVFVSLAFFGLAARMYFRGRSVLSRIKANKAVTSVSLTLASEQEKS